MTDATSRTQLDALRHRLAPAAGVQLPAATTGSSGRSREAAVAAILRDSRTTGGLELLLITRAHRDGDVWSGQVALPGGRREPHDADLVATAVREVHEEVGVDLLAAPTGGELLGALPPRLPMNPALPPIAVQPFAWLVEHAEPHTSDEVAAVSWVSLEHLRAEEHRREHRLTTPDGTERVLPAIHLGTDVPLWGMTHRIVETLLDLLT